MFKNFIFTKNYFLFKTTDWLEIGEILMDQLVQNLD
jgi:hypothetical protein